MRRGKPCAASAAAASSAHLQAGTPQAPLPRRVLCWGAHLKSPALLHLPPVAECNESQGCTSARGPCAQRVLCRCLSSLRSHMPRRPPRAQDKRLGARPGPLQCITRSSRGAAERSAKSTSWATKVSAAAARALAPWGAGALPDWPHCPPCAEDEEGNVYCNLEDCPQCSYAASIGKATCATLGCAAADCSMNSGCKACPAGSLLIEACLGVRMCVPEQVRTCGTRLRAACNCACATPCVRPQAARLLTAAALLLAAGPGVHGRRRQGPGGVHRLPRRPRAPAPGHHRRAGRVWLLPDRATGVRGRRQGGRGLHHLPGRALPGNLQQRLGQAQPGSYGRGREQLVCSRRARGGPRRRSLHPRHAPLRQLR